MLFGVISFIAVLSILVLVHELGHFIMAKKTGVLVEEFGFGLPPRIFGKKIGDTIYSLNLLPIGGFVKLHGEDEETSVKYPQKAFINKSKKVKTVIVVAGVVMNVLLAIFAFALVYSFSGIPKAINTGKVEILEVRKDSPAQDIGLKPGDIIEKIDNRSISTTDELTQIVDSQKGNEITLLVQRTDEQNLLEFKVTPRINPPANEGALGIAISSTEVTYEFPPLWQRPFIGIYYGVLEAVFWGKLVIIGFYTMIKSLFMGIVPTDVAGPAGLLALTSEVSKQGILAVVNWMGIISINLAIINIVPFPAFDGGRLAFIWLEKMFGKKLVSNKVESYIHTIGLAFLILLMIAITVREIRLIIHLGFSGFVNYITQGQQ